MATSDSQPNWNSITLFESFQHEVQVLAPAPNNLRVANIDITKKPQGLSTQNAKAPQIWFPRKVAVYTQRAGQIIHKHRDALSESYLPAPYNPCVLRSESDIVQASVLWLLHPVVKALQAEFPNVQYAAEVTIDDCRCDALISIKNEPMVVIEYKSRGNLKRLQFEDAKIDDSSEENKVYIGEMREEAETRKHKSKLHENRSAPERLEDIFLCTNKYFTSILHLVGSQVLSLFPLIPDTNSLAISSNI